MTSTLKLITISGVNFEITAEQTNKIADVKKKVFEVIGRGYEPETLKLIFEGKILKDDSLVSELPPSSVENGRIVVLGTTAILELKSKTDQQLPFKKPLLSNNAQLLKMQLPISTLSFPAVKGSDNKTDLTSFLEKMGVSKQQIDYSLRMARYDPSKALDYVIELEELPGKRFNVEVKYVGRDLQTHRPEINPDKPSSFTKFINHPIFERLCKDMVAEPTLIIPMLAELRKYDPKVLEYILAHPTEFGQIVLENYRKVHIGPPNPNPTNSKLTRDKINRFVQNLTNEEKLQLQKLCAYGYSMDELTEALYLCDRNFNHTIQYLFLKGPFFEDDT